MVTELTLEWDEGVEIEHPFCYHYSYSVQLRLKKGVCVSHQAMPHADPEVRAAYQQEYKQKNKEKLRVQYRDSKRRIRAKQSAAKKKDTRLRADYGITLADYQEMYDEQEGKCAICGGRAFGGKLLHVDHNHETGKVRGLLCDHCNWMLGHGKDSPERLIAGAKYLLERDG